MGRLTHITTALALLLCSLMVSAANLTESARWENGIYRIELSDPVEGGENGVDNRQAKQLGNRTLYLKREQDSLKTKVNQATASVSSVNTSLNTLGARVTTNTNDITNLKPLTAKVNTNTSDIAGLKTTTATHTADIAALQSNTGLPAHNHDDRYYTKAQSDGKYALKSSSSSVSLKHLRVSFKFVTGATVASRSIQVLQNPNNITVRFVGNNVYLDLQPADATMNFPSRTAVIINNFSTTSTISGGTGASSAAKPSAHVASVSAGTVALNVSDYTTYVDGGDNISTSGYAVLHADVSILMW